MNSLIQIVNKLQDVFAVVGGNYRKVNLPQIVVVGTQSSGKSSVLESLVGRSFLPRGTGVVTRAPLIIQMIKYTDEDRERVLSNAGENVTVWAEFLHLPKTVFFDFDEVRDEIELWTDKLAGGNKGITDKQIVLKVYTQLYDLTFVDLPGITKVAVGDQPYDIDEQINKLILSYVKESNSIILAVVPANTDPSTCECLQIAKKLDPEGTRTIAVVTKLDIIDEGTLQDTTELLLGNRIPIKLGIIGVVNRNQKDTVENKSMQDALKSEEDFLKKFYPDIYKKHGRKALARTLQSVLIEHIKNVYPELKERLEEMKKKLEQKMLTLTTPDNNVSFLIGLLKEISKSYENIIRGNQDDMSADEVFGGARIVQIFEREYVMSINDIEPLQDITNENIANILLNTAGTNTSTFVNEKALQKIVSIQIEKLVEPSLECVDLVRDEMLNIFDWIDSDLIAKLKRFPELNKNVRMVFSSLLEENINDIKDFIESYLETYCQCLNTCNPDFLSEVMKSEKEFEISFIHTKENPHKLPNVTKIHMFQQLLSGISENDTSLASSEQVKLHKDLGRCYYNWARRVICDFVPKRIKHKLVNAFVNDLDKNMNEKIFQKYLIENKINSILSREHKNFQEDRQDIEMKLDAVKKALNNIIDIKYF